MHRHRRSRVREVATARDGGALICEGVKVTGVARDGRRVTGVDWQAEDGSTGHLACGLVVNCAGMWARQVGKMAGVSVPLQACEHFYMLTESIPDLGALPVLRVPDECAYYKEDAGKILLGAFEPRAKPWGMEGIPEDFCFDAPSWQAVALTKLKREAGPSSVRHAEGEERLALRIWPPPSTSQLFALSQCVKTTSLGCGGGASGIGTARTSSLQSPHMSGALPLITSALGELSSPGTGFL